MKLNWYKTLVFFVISTQSLAMHNSHYLANIRDCFNAQADCAKKEPLLLTAHYLAQLFWGHQLLCYGPEMVRNFVKSAQSAYEKNPVATIAGAALTAGAAYYALKTENKKPTQKALNIVTFIPCESDDKNAAFAHLKDIFSLNYKNTKIEAHYKAATRDFSVHNYVPTSLAKAETIFIFSPWFNLNRENFGLRCAFPYLNQGIINAPCVTFDYPDNRCSANFGQALDQEYLATVIREVLTINPRAKIVLVGRCRGAMAILHFLAFYPDQTIKKAIKGAILDSPPLSAQRKFTNMGAFWVLPFMKLCYPNSNMWPQTLFDATSFPDIPILIGRAQHNLIAPHCTINHIAQHLKRIGCNTVYLFTSQDDNLHEDKLFLDTNFVLVSNAFLKEHNLPHDYATAYQYRIDLPPSSLFVSESHHLLQQAKKEAEDCVNQH